MATLLLTVGAATIVGTKSLGIGAALGAAIMSGAAIAGSIYDSQILMPALMKPPPIESGRIHDFNFHVANEGGPIHKCYGPAVRVPGTILYLSELIELVRNESAKGMNAQKVENYTYYCDVAIAACSGPITRIKKIWADGKILYNDITSINITSTQISAEIFKRMGIGYTSDFQQALGLGVEVVQRYVDIVAPIDFNDPDFSDLRSGVDVTISGFADSRLNGTFKVVHVRDRGSDIIFRVRNDAAFGFESAGQSVTIAQVASKYDPLKAAGFTFYTGTTTQDPDTLLESALGSGSVPAYRGIAYAVINNLAIGDYGNRLPQFQMLVESDTSATYGDVIGNILESCGLESTDYDVSACTESVRGYIVSGLQRGIDALPPLLIVGDILVQESNSKLVFFPRSAASTITVDADDLAAHEIGEDAPRPIETEEIDDRSLPTEVNVRFIDPTLDYQPGSVGEIKQDVLHTRKDSFDLDVSLYSSEARAVSGRLLWDAWNNRESDAVALPPSYLTVEEGDIIQIPISGETRSVIVSETARGFNFLNQLQGVVESSTAHTGLGEDSSLVDQKIGVPATIDIEVIDLAPFQDNQKLVPGYYYVVANFDSAESWRGAALYTSKNENFFDADSVATKYATMGEAGVVSAETEYIIETGESAKTSSVGLWLPTRHDDAISTDVMVSRENGASYTFTQTLGGVGTYNLYLRWTYATDRANEAHIIITHDGGVKHLYINQADVGAHAQWVHLGEYTFTSTITMEVGSQGLDDDGNIVSTCVDAFRAHSITASGVLGDGPVGYWDRNSTVRVTLNSGTLESREEIDVLNGLNYAIIGNEVVAFQDATLVSGKTYDLTNLLRGLRNTEDYIPSHRGTERFILLEAVTLNFMEVNQEEIGKTEYIKAVAPGEDPENIEPEPFIIHAQTIVPFAPAQLTAEAYVSPTSGDGMRLEWIYRSRAIVQVFNTTAWGIPHIDFGSYTVEVWDADGARLRTVRTLSDGYFYSNNNQQVDGVSASDVLTITVYETSDSGVVGKRASVTVTSTL